MKQIIIVGAGASGLVAAIKAAAGGAAVTVLEQNDRPGRKICATGNGRCNMTNLNQAEGVYRGTHPEFAKDALEQFSGNSFRNWESASQTAMAGSIPGAIRPKVS